LVHSETSTGVALDLEALADVVHQTWPNALLGVDAITSLGIHPLHMDAWGLDLVVSASQKGLGCPPGLATLGVSERAQAIMQGRPATTYTLNVSTILDSMARGLFPWTPPVTLVAALDVALNMILAEGMEHVWNRHQDLASYTQQQLRNRGYDLFGDASSHAVTVVADPGADALRQLLLERHEMVIAGGQDQLQGKVFRIGTCGWVHRSDIDDLLAAIDDVRPLLP
jgi:aspartate aminotransferase-like enzyme